MANDPPRTSMKEPKPTKAIFFDLNDTLFDERHSLRQAMAAVQREFTGLEERTVDQLVRIYKDCQKLANDQYFDRLNTLEGLDDYRVEQFFDFLQMPPPSFKVIEEFYRIHNTAYMQSWRATPGTVETLTSIREHGYRIGIITNTQFDEDIQDLLEKTQAIGIGDLIDCIVTSEQVGYRKPDPLIFNHAIKKLDAPLYDTYMVGDSLDSDIIGALDADLTPILYHPAAYGLPQFPNGRPVLVIERMNQVLEYLGIASQPSL
ncbi:hypothetical protein G7046_g4949 [Stylonectria norvegica]|nr:hypothetical protein G7046_g4949 [Stylonectria norvegica]